MVEEPIEIRDLSKHSDYTSRQSHLAENNRKIGGSNKFSFRKFKTDKEKLEEYTQKKLEEDIYKEKIKPEKEIKIKPSLTFLKNKAKTLEDIFNNAKYIILDEVKFDDQDLKLIDDKAKRIEEL